MSICDRVQRSYHTADLQGRCYGTNSARKHYFVGFPLEKRERKKEMSSREKDFIVTPYESALNDPFEARFTELRKKQS